MKESKEYRSLGHCRFCNEEVFGTHHNKLQTHQRFCLCNLNRQKALTQITNASKNAATESVRKKVSLTKKLNAEKTYKVYTFICKKCGTRFERKLKIKHFEEGYRIPQYCCNSCANSHVHTIESKQKISKSVSKERLHICPKCGKEFIHNGSAISTTWCNECFEKETGHSREFFISNGKCKYGKGNPRKIGNDVSLHLSNCPTCGKLIWSKTSDIVYCYDCVKKYHKRIHQLFDSSGHKVVSDETKKKLSFKIQQCVKNGTHQGWTTRNKTSYAEKFWINVLNNNQILFQREIRISKFKYFLDFEIVLNNGLKIDLEIDGKQHKYLDRQLSDKRRDKNLRSLGYLVYRVEWNNLNTKKNKVQYGSLKMKAKIRQFLWWLNQMKSVPSNALS